MPTMARMTRTASGILSQTSDVMLPPVESAGSGSADTPKHAARDSQGTWQNFCGPYEVRRLAHEMAGYRPLHATKDKVRPHLWPLATTRPAVRQRFARGRARSLVQGQPLADLVHDV